ncbi:putative alginate O-acetylase AlgI [Desulfovibrionales bacterium]
MNFTESIFIPFFLVVIGCFALARRRPTTQVRMLLIASLIFYGWWRIDFLGLLLFICLMDYLVGITIHRLQQTFHRKALLALSIVTNLSILCFFKYYTWISNNCNWVLPQLGLPTFPTWNIILPIGISFYTFRSMSYIVDIYRGRMSPCTSLFYYVTAMTAFPQLVAGPIVRARNLIPQFYGNLTRRSDHSGLWLMLWGYLKKMTIADPLGTYIVNPIFADIASHSAPELILAAYAFTFQIFFDFSGYSDIAIGLGRIFGLRLTTNFRSPYLASNISDFWRRWHITLSAWFRDYLYIPLGGSRCSRLTTARNLMLTMLITGLWHGASGTFLIWGGLHGLYSCIFHEFDLAVRNGHFVWWTNLPKTIRIVIFFQLLTVTWIFFRLPSLAACWIFFARLFTAPWDTLHATSCWPWLFTIAAAAHYFIEPFLDSLVALASCLSSLMTAAAYVGLFALLYWLSELNINHQAFIYFQF